MVSTPTTAAGTESKPDINQMAGRVQHLHKFKHFYDQMDFSPEQRLAISKSIIKLTDPAESGDLVKGRSRHRDRLDDCASIFYDDDLRGLPTSQ